MLLFYAAQKNHAVDALEEMLAERLPPHKVSYCNDMDALEKRLRRPRYDLNIIMICICDAIEMVKLSELRPLLLDLRLLLILPKRDDDTVAWAHQFAPRFIAYADSRISQVAAVLEKMIKNSRTNVLPFEQKRMEARAAYK
jgi:hypothetical protein